MPDVTVGPSGRDYPTLAAAEAGEEGDLSTIGPLNFLCDAFTDTTLVSFTGWTNSSATNFITVTPASGAEHGGVPGQGYILDVSSGGSAFYCNVGYTVVTGITIDNDSGFAFSFGGVSSPALKNCIINGGTSYAISMTAGAGIKIMNNRIVGGTGGIYCARFVVEIHNNTIVGASITGIESTQNSANVIVKNNVCVDSTTSDFNLHANTTVSNNASGDTTATGTGAVTGISTSDGVDFVEPSTGNYQPTSTSALAGAGTDLSGTFTDDITGATRSTPWDIGAYIAAGGGGISLTVSDLSNSQSLDAVTLTQAFIAAVNDLSNSQSLDAVTLTTAGDLFVDSLAEGHALSEVSLLESAFLTLAGLSQAQAVGVVSLLQANSLGLDSLVQQSSLSDVTLSVAGSISADALTQSMQLGAVSLVQKNSLSVFGLDQSQQIAVVSIFESGALSVDGLLQLSALDSLTLTPGGALLVVDQLQSSQSVDQVVLTERAVLSINELSQAQITDIVTLGGVVVGELDGTLIFYSLMDGDITLH